MKAAVVSFGYGAIGPLSAIYGIWQSNEASSKSERPMWVLAYGGAAIPTGLWTYGYNMMRHLENRLTVHSPSPGFSIELGAALTIVTATRLALPIPTTQCITGATVGVGGWSGTLRAINWRMLAWIYFDWIRTLPIAGLVSYSPMAIIVNAPSWELMPTTAT
ncbi:PiT family inorganic phosphate transporter [Exophiala aquamarina CBS 119918]|uniref:PiT family inorganic phosphate transporter n=1 Tax=Exophiala aquamarina CBS 119918 TaxID=1182545 RepID=A0A072P3L2_9EURO|nr:PiT family inorganic phosphate transporter [Exophiala aquamarina CBS 119918]KEF54714.1 PiT family inorganic phosphate transporter [Exophiala aquamarina CBS 119918]